MQGVSMLYYTAYISYQRLQFSRRIRESFFLFFSLSFVLAMWESIHWRGKDMRHKRRLLSVLCDFLNVNSWALEARGLDCGLVGRYKYGAAYFLKNFSSFESLIVSSTGNERQSNVGHRHSAACCQKSVQKWGLCGWSFWGWDTISLLCTVMLNNPDSLHLCAVLGSVIIVSHAD